MSGTRSMGSGGGEGGAEAGGVDSSALLVSEELRESLDDESTWLSIQQYHRII